MRAKERNLREEAENMRAVSDILDTAGLSGRIDPIFITLSVVIDGASTLAALKLLQDGGLLDEINVSSVLRTPNEAVKAATTLVNTTNKSHIGSLLRFGTFPASSRAQPVVNDSMSLLSPVQR